MAADWPGIFQQPGNPLFAMVVDMWKCRSRFSFFPDYFSVSLNRSMNPGELLVIAEVRGEPNVWFRRASYKYGRILRRPQQVIYGWDDITSNVIPGAGRAQAQSATGHGPWPGEKHIVLFNEGGGAPWRILTPVFNINELGFRYTGVVNPTLCYNREPTP